ncbi:hypothetical protein [Tunturibacter empetritectus]|uniref:Zinc-finger domain-containing protein n=1 Tax=Tunturiibacter lichenicola TaxID=2051959 RepID=A0A7W8N3G9_9BACT|nr:hypothetical protein [Edaphobacter lichenicola]MBB5343458.1 hypothetical protein [Edaphobacter lichenicola]
MDHEGSVKSQAVERYLLGDMPAASQEDFAAHFFSCTECAEDLKMTSLFLDVTRTVIKEDKIVGQASVKKSPLSRWRSARYAIAASVACLSFMLYQNLVVIPRLKTAAAPQAVEVFPITNAESRGGAQTAISPVAGKPYLLLVDIPPHDERYRIRFVISNAAGVEVFADEVPDKIAQNTVPFLISPWILIRGEYSLQILGRSEEKDSFTTVARYSFHVN